MGSSQNWIIFFGSILCILGSFLTVDVQNGNFFFGGGGGTKISKILWGMPDITDIFGIE